MAPTDGIIDLLVLGGGTAGIIGAKTAAGFGARTVLVEQERTGGDCLWTGCVPSKTLLSAAAQARNRRPAGGGNPDFSAIRERIAAAIRAIEPADTPEALEEAGVEVLSGHVSFTGPGTAVLNGEVLRFRQALIATGAEPAKPRFTGLDPARTVTSETVWDLTALPGRLAILGGGPIACELGQAFARLGADVTMIVRSRILAKETPEAVDIIRESLKADGVTILENSSISHATSPAQGHRLHLDDGTTVDADTVLLAAGRTPRTTGIGLEHVGVHLDDRGHVLTNEHMQTTNPLIWAAGDVTTHPQFTHLAGVHASVAASNAVLGLRRRISPAVPRVTYTSPEIAAVISGGSGQPVTSRTVWDSHLDRAVTEDRTEGFTELLVGRGGRVMGGTIVGPRAGESLAELSLAVHKKLTTSDIAGATHAYPTYSDGIWNAAVLDVRERLRSPLRRTAIKALATLRRLALDARRINSKPGNRPQSDVRH
ncbi:pyruvate/2-oxoglutarate dehydrogenase complex dihydrolipoamide dehydrogenase (E3) component [Arthrobacter oryzae]|uniref:dihydrolipoyl dehydrogenase family protein n=1 Tax=Arthrobacter oryzae TaxID=409290 RepID=UPI00278AF179|nr:FAD-dependent oxidoreductase [Arthrobacter oryzae]MDP9987343.1 pyruvate/2-oxoglutarate dehydrogenase complex dihydrolipoamide dehydrogenase (E3) component [Arthrobacter oryzae]